VRIVSCLEEPSDCPQLLHCSLRRPVQKLQAAMTQMLDGMSLAELASDDVPEMLSIAGVKESDRWR
jgi:DNA-binding IscR family transcriptional regulator